MLWDRVGFSVVGWAGTRGGTRHTWHRPIPIIINNKFTRPSSISTLGDFSLSQNGQPILAQLNFHTLKKSGQCSPKHKLFSDFLVSYRRSYGEMAHTHILVEFSILRFSIISIVHIPFNIF